MVDLRKNSLTRFILLAAVVLLAGWLRFTNLQQRPMHCDEAVHAEKFGELLERGVYRYDYYEYHGPTLNYLTLLPAVLRGDRTYITLSETTMRMVPAFIGTLLVLLPALLRRQLGWPVVLTAVVLTAFSPAMVYYSRYYIQETLLVCFTFSAIICGIRYADAPRIGWALGLGGSLGLMHATKETCLIAYGALAAAYVGVKLWKPAVPATAGSQVSFLPSLPSRHIAAAIMAGGLVSMAFFSSFGSHPAGIIDSFRTWLTYFDRAGSASVHIHPWYMYFQWLFCFQFQDGPFWSEGFIALGAVCGFAICLRGWGQTTSQRQLGHFLALYTLFMTVIYSLIPYKTPWCLLGFLQGMILLAAIGFCSVIQALRFLPLKIGIILACLVGVAHLGWQAHRAGLDRQWDADPRNPYVYAHTCYDIYAISSRVHEVAAAADEDECAVQVFFANNYWPLPWYLRSLDNVGFSHHVLMDASPAPVILADPEQEPEVLKVIFENPPPGRKEIYLPLFTETMEIRPRVPINGYIVKSLWDRWQIQHSETIFDEAP